MFAADRLVGTGKVAEFEVQLVTRAHISNVHALQYKHAGRRDGTQSRLPVTRFIVARAR